MLALEKIIDNEETQKMLLGLSAPGCIFKDSFYRVDIVSDGTIESGVWVSQLNWQDVLRNNSLTEKELIAQANTPENYALTGIAEFTNIGSLLPMLGSLELDIPSESEDIMLRLIQHGTALIWNVSCSLRDYKNSSEYLKAKSSAKELKRLSGLLINALKKIKIRILDFGHYSSYLSSLPFAGYNFLYDPNPLPELGLKTENDHLILSREFYSYLPSLQQNSDRAAQISGVEPFSDHNDETVTLKELSWSIEQILPQLIKLSDSIESKRGPAGKTSIKVFIHQLAKIFDAFSGPWCRSVSAAEFKKIRSKFIYFTTSLTGDDKGDDEHSSMELADFEALIPLVDDKIAKNIGINS